MIITMVDLSYYYRCLTYVLHHNLFFSVPDFSNPGCLFGNDEDMLPPQIDGLPAHDIIIVYFLMYNDT